MELESSRIEQKRQSPDTMICESAVPDSDSGAKTKVSSRPDDLDKSTEAKQSADEDESGDYEEPLNFSDLMKAAWRVVKTALVCIVIVTVCSIIYGFAVDRHFTLTYASMANMVVAAVLILAGLVMPHAPNRLIDRFKTRQLADYTMQKTFMAQRKQKQKQGNHIMRIGFAVALIAGAVDVVIWLVT